MKSIFSATLFLSQAGCATALVETLTQPVDITTSVDSVSERIDKIERSNPTGRARIVENFHFDRLQFADGVIWLRYEVERMRMVELREEVRMTKVTRYRVYNPLLDILELPAAIADLPFLILMQPFVDDRSGWNRALGLDALGVEGYFRRRFPAFLLPGMIGNNVRRSEKRIDLPQVRLREEMEGKSTSTVAGAKVEVILGSKTRVLETGLDGELKIDLRELGVESSDFERSRMTLTVDGIRKFSCFTSGPSDFYIFPEK